MSQAWFIRAGRDDEFEELDFAEGVVAIGWQQVGDLTACASQSDIAQRGLRRLSRRFRADARLVHHPAARLPAPHATGRHRGSLARQAPTIAVGRITGDYRYAPTGPSRHMRPVEWLDRSPCAGTVRAGS